ncbi:MAG TPA: NAD(P)/FAD-dependent oxidoreductase [Polyangiales bacterium]|nr:NAD(P)/FAD-dependent oxidoreductase [Polyangiales bacterium]
MLYDIAIVGGGPAGLSAALALGRARKRVLLCDAGPRRNAAAQHMHNFVTRDGIPPEAFRSTAREQLAPYTSVETRAAHVESITGERGAFRLQLSDGQAEARRVLLATGMVDETLPIEGFRELWGSAVFQCPYCHGWEVQDRRWGYLARTAEWSHISLFVQQLRGWTRHVTLFVTEAFELPDDTRLQLEAAGVRCELSPVKRLVAHGAELTAVELASGASVACDVLFAHPPQRQVALIQNLGVALDADGFVAADAMRRETSIPGIYAAGDLGTRMQGAIIAAAAGMQAAAMINMELTQELARL